MARRTIPLFLALCAAVAGLAAGEEARSGPVLELEWTTFCGSSADDYVEGAAADAQGNLYIAGTLNRYVVPNTEAFRDFPNIRVPKHPKAGDGYGFVAKVTPAGETVWTVYLSGEGLSRVGDVAVDGQGNVFIIGSADNPGVPQCRSFRPGVYVSRLKPEDGSVLWTTCLGIVEWPVGVDPAMATDAEGNVYVAHETSYAWGGKLLGPLKNEKGGGGDAFVTKLTPDGAIAWSSFIGGEEGEVAHGVALAGDGSIYIGGKITPWLNRPPGQAFPLAGFANTWNGGGEAFVACLGASGAPQWARLLGGTGGDEIRRVALAASGDLIVAGGYSADVKGPVRGDRTHGGPFLARVDRSGKVQWIVFGDFWDRAGCGGLAVSADGKRAILSSVNVHGLGLTQVDADSGQLLRPASYEQLLGTSRIGARHVVQAGRAGGYYLVDGTTETALPKRRGNAPVARIDVFIAKITENVPAPPKEPVIACNIQDGAHYPGTTPVPFTWSADMGTAVKSWTTSLNGQTLSTGGGRPGSPNLAGGTDNVSGRPGDNTYTVTVETVNGKKFEKSVKFVVEPVIAPPPPPPPVTPPTPVIPPVIPPPPVDPPTPPPPPTTTTEGAANLVAETKTVLVGSVAAIAIRAVEVANLGSLNFTLIYDPAVVTVEGVDKGDLLVRVGAQFRANTNEAGLIRFGFASRAAVSETGPLAQVRFKAVGKAGSSSPLMLGEVLSTDAAGKDVALRKTDGRVTIAAPEEILAGDANGDGKLTILDALDALSMSVKLMPERKAADVDGNGRVTAEDARRIITMVVSE